MFDAKTQTLLLLLETNEKLETIMKRLSRIDELDFEYVTENVWSDVQSISRDSRKLIDELKKTTPNVAKLLDDDELMAHMRKVVGSN